MSYSPIHPRDSYKLYQVLNERYFENALPPVKEIVTVQPGGAAKILDARHTLGAVWWDDEGHPHMELHGGLDISADLKALIMAHEMVHIKHPKKALRHGTKVWREEQRRLAGLGFFEKIF